MNPITNYRTLLAAGSPPVHIRNLTSKQLTEVFNFLATKPAAVAEFNRLKNIIIPSTEYGTTPTRYSIFEGLFTLGSDATIEEFNQNAGEIEKKMMLGYIRRALINVVDTAIQIAIERASPLAKILSAKVLSAKIAAKIAGGTKKVTSRKPGACGPYAPPCPEGCRERAGYTTKHGKTFPAGCSRVPRKFRRSTTKSKSKAKPKTKSKAKSKTKTKSKKSKSKSNGKRIRIKSYVNSKGTRVKSYLRKIK